MKYYTAVKENSKKLRKLFSNTLSQNLYKNEEFRKNFI